MFRIILAFLVFLLVTFLFKKASGNLSFRKLNMISVFYYYVVVLNLAGASLIYCGVRDHYMVTKIRLAQTIDYTYYALAYTLIMFPIVLIIMKKLLSNLSKQKDIDTYIASPIIYNRNMVSIQEMVLLMMAICTLSTLYVFSNLGYIPIISMFHGGNLNVLRQSGNRFFKGNQYVKNLLMVTLTPFTSYLTYIYYKITKSRLWKLMLFYMTILSVIVLTYDFSKSPIISYLLGLYLLEVIMGNVRNNKKFNKLVISSCALILFFYIIMLNASDQLFSIYSGPIGRILFSQIATLFLHMEVFPLRYPYLNGASFNEWMSFLIPSAKGLRSGRVVMSIYNAVGVETNTAGVMNTVFIGEAHANFGPVGVIIAPILFGIIISIFACLITRARKNPVSMLLYVQMTLQFVTVVEGGFVDIFYSASTIFLMFISILLYIIQGSCNIIKI